ncbi:Prolyl 4-hydroxylase 13 [Lachnellula arida]|uniref:Prolyl 4-hydroxylase 13 n=1 Tax=Lachnellula arida TaxID=1316785 RepID=A0A8T9BN83_9HELO|nr:Prolyl 4-hydroxylase 13 [Lachnellula arida]
MARPVEVEVRGVRPPTSPPPSSTTPPPPPPPPYPQHPTAPPSPAPLPPASPPVSCILSRARSFLSPSLLSDSEDFGTPQIVRYAPGQKFDLHYDWYPSPQPLSGRRGLSFNRVASFFVYLDESEASLKKGGERDGDGDGDVGGETWFPYIETRGEGKGNGNGGKKWRKHEDGGTAFRPRRGNAVFWVNLHGNGTGDERVQHAGLPLREGVKTAMNIWPRRVYGG